MRGLSASGEEASGEGLDGADNPAGGHGLAGRDAIFLLATIAQQLTRIADAAERISGSTAMPQQKETEQQQKETVQDELHAILQDKKLYEETVKWAATCRKPKELRARICLPLKQNGFRRFDKDFFVALIPHLTNYECNKTDYRNLQRVFY